jgi:hypothetical protein
MYSKSYPLSFGFFVQKKSLVGVLFHIMDQQRGIAHLLTSSMINALIPWLSVILSSEINIPYTNINELVNIDLKLLLSKPPDFANPVKKATGIP